ncbi:MAG: hypothetical protein M3081_17640 [Gemmatimonadota bacterium]|nr:hypothetical protein [Gemmatimonadota bacterium]
MNSNAMPGTVFTIWWIGLIVTLVIFVPLSVYLLHRTYIAARSIKQYAAETLKAAAGIAGNTQHIPALDATIAVGGSMVAVAGEIAAKLEAAGGVLAGRAK